MAEGRKNARSIPTGDRTKKSPVSPQEEAEFLEHLATYGVMASAARKVGRSLSTFQHKRSRDPRFRERVDEALANADARLETELYRRAVEGVQKPLVSGGKWLNDPETGEPAYITEYSDNLLLAANRARIHRFRKQQEIHVTHASHPDESRITERDLAYLTADEQRNMVRMLEKIAAGRRRDQGEENFETEQAVTADWGVRGLPDGVEDAEFEEVSDTNEHVSVDENGDSLEDVL